MAQAQAQLKRGAGAGSQWFHVCHCQHLPEPGAQQICYRQLASVLGPDVYPQEIRRQHLYQVFLMPSQQAARHGLPPAAAQTGRRVCYEKVAEVLFQRHFVTGLLSPSED